MDQETAKRILENYRKVYRESYPEYSAVVVVPVDDEDPVRQHPDIAPLLAEDYEIIDINAFGDCDGRAASAAILGKE